MIKAEFAFEDWLSYFIMKKEEVESFELYDDDSILIYLKDGRTLWYDPILKTGRLVRMNGKVTPDEKEWNSHFGISLQRRMRQKGVLQYELSEMTGISVVTLSSYINGKRKPSGHNIALIAQALGCTERDLMHFPD